MPGFVRLLGALLTSEDAPSTDGDEDDSTVERTQVTTDTATEHANDLEDHSDHGASTDAEQSAGPGASTVTENAADPRRPESEPGTGLTMAAVFEAIPRPAFLIDNEHTVLQYNTGLNRLLGLADDHREFIGGDNRETIAAATYTDGRRHQSLVDKVAENPRDAEVHWDVERVDADIPYTDQPVYEDTSVSKSADGEEVHIGFLAIPIFDGDGELDGVFELVEDRSDEIRHQQAVTELVSAVTGTLDDIGAGDLSARVEFEDEHDVLDPALLELTSAVNQMAGDFEGLVDGVDTKTGELAESIQRTNESSARIDQQVAAQTESLEAVVNEMQDFSATMEEVAASSNQVASAAEEALVEAESGVETGEVARDATAEVMAISDELTETVTELDRYMNEIEEVVEVISEVAEQTNMLALNANIEAARADESGAGFAVVADEVKALANETRTQTEAIAERIDAIQAHSNETVRMVSDSHAHVQDVEDAIADAVESFETISEATGSAATGIQNVADANDEQAATVEEVVSTVESVLEGSEEISETTAEIVDEADSQEVAVTELAERVEALSTDR